MLGESAELMPPTCSKHEKQRLQLLENHDVPAELLHARLEVIKRLLVALLRGLAPLRPSAHLPLATRLLLYERKRLPTQTSVTLSSANAGPPNVTKTK